jgi:hypothetical protein
MLDKVIIPDMFIDRFIQTIESSAREFLGKDKSTTLAASVVSYEQRFLIFLFYIYKREHHLSSCAELR